MTLVIENIEDVDENGTTRGWIVPAGAETGADLELEAIDFIDVPADEDEKEWNAGLRRALVAAGWELAGEIQHDGPTITAPVKPRD